MIQIKTNMQLLSHDDEIFDIHLEFKHEVKVRRENDKLLGFDINLEEFDVVIIKEGIEYERYNQSNYDKLKEKYKDVVDKED